MQDGHKPVQIFTFFTDGKFDHNAKVLNIAAAHNIPVSFSKPTQGDIDALVKRGCELFISAAYIHKIPSIPDNAYGMNIHPTLLPKGRGKFPLPHVMLNHRDTAGVTLHKLADKMDEGDILMQKPISLSDEDDLETLSSKIVMHAPHLLAECVSDIETHWNAATPQDASQASLWPYPEDNMRTVNWNMPVSEIDRIGRAFSRIGWLCHLQGQDYWIYNYSLWQEDHDMQPSTIAAVTDREVTVAAKDGFICLKEFSPK